MNSITVASPRGRDLLRLTDWTRPERLRDEEQRAVAAPPPKKKVKKEEGKQKGRKGFGRTVSSQLRSYQPGQDEESRVRFPPPHSISQRGAGRIASHRIA